MRYLLFLFFLTVLPLFTRAQNEPAKGENLMLYWPENEHWKKGDDQENKGQHVIDLIHENETIDQWTELANMTAFKGVMNVPMDTAMAMMFRSSQAEAPKAKLGYIKRGESGNSKWIIFSIEAPGFTNDTTPESQLWFIIQGRDALYTNFVAVKKATLTDDFKKKWAAFFETAKLVYQ